jgi:hypothetical protein
MIEDSTIVRCVEERGRCWMGVVVGRVELFLGLIVVVEEVELRLATDLVADSGSGESGLVGVMDFGVVGGVRERSMGTVESREGDKEVLVFLFLAAT